MEGGHCHLTLFFVARPALLQCPFCVVVQGRDFDLPKTAFFRMETTALDVNLQVESSKQAAIIKAIDKVTWYRSCIGLAGTRHLRE